MNENGVSLQGVTGNVIDGIETVVVSGLPDRTSHEAGRSINWPDYNNSEAAIVKGTKNGDFVEVVLRDGLRTPMNTKFLFKE